MRCMLKVTIPVESGNRGIKDGSLPKTIQSFQEEFKPEAAYFTACGGDRTGFFFLEVKDSSYIPAIAERFFMGLNARVEFSPVMNGEELAAGLGRLAKSL